LQLRRALDSIAEQKFPDPFEVLIIDDGSTSPVENVRDRISPITLSSVTRFIRTSRNNGLVHALNLGINESRYEYIARLDSDDRWRPTKIEKQFKLFERDTDLSITATGMNTVTPEGAILECHIRPGDWNGILRFSMETGCPFPHGSVLARRDVFRTLGGYSHHPDVAYCEDYALWSIWLRFFKAAMVEEPLYDYTISPYSLSSAHGEQQRRASRLVNTRFAAIDPIDRVPRALHDLAIACGLSMLEAGTLAYRCWAYRPTVRLPSDAVAALKALMPDRVLLPEVDNGQASVSLERIVGRRGNWQTGETTLARIL
jgi:glycosyltransferase involved in cell wall biosynthesis